MFISLPFVALTTASRGAWMHESISAAIEQRTRRKNADRPRGRRALLWAVGLFALSQGALGFILANDGFVIRDPIRHGRSKVLRARMAEAPSAPKVVVLLGSSHVEAGLRALQMSREVSASLGRPVVVANRGVLGGGALRSSRSASSCAARGEIVFSGIVMAPARNARARDYISPV